VVSLINVDTINETFYVRMMVRLIWCAKDVPSLGGTKVKDEISNMINGMEDADRDWKPEWYPEFGIRNRVETQETVENFIAVCTAHHEKEDDWEVLGKENKLKKEDFWIIRQTSMNVVINALEELQLFPFDIQDLKILVRMDHPTQAVQVREMESLPDTVRTCVPEHITVPAQSLTVNFDNLQTAERSYWRSMPCKLKLGNDFGNRSHGQICGGIHVSIHVQRRIGHYLYNVFLMVGLITSLSAAVWAIETKKIEDRLATDATLLLTIQAFKVAIADKLPKVNYLTLVDEYILACFLFNLAATCLHIRTGWHGMARGEEDNMDEKVHILWCSSWLLYNLGFAIYCAVSRSLRLRSLRNEAIRGRFQILTEAEADVDHVMSKSNQPLLLSAKQLLTRGLKLGTFEHSNQPSD
jgi:hypothetical protein